MEPSKIMDLVEILEKLSRLIKLDDELGAADIESLEQAIAKCKDDDANLSVEKKHKNKIYLTDCLTDEGKSRSGGILESWHIGDDLQDAANLLKTLSFVED